jgi:hypothetical protein
LATGGSSGNGCGIYNNSGSPTLTNVSIAGNKANTNGGGMYNYGSPVIQNSIIYGNSTGIVNTGAGSPVISYSIVQGASAPAGTDNSNADPLFVTWIDPSPGGWVATSNGDYSLQAGSPAIDAGNDSLYLTARGIGAFTSSEKDLAGGERKKGAAIDMGAYERQ